MEKYLAAILLTASFSVNATLVGSIRTICTDPVEFAETMSKHGEVPLARGKSNRVLEDVPYQGVVVVFMNPETRSFTIAEKITEDVVCIISMGIEFEPLDDEGNSLEESKQYKGT